MEQIFVSSVQKELQAERYAVRDFVHSNDLFGQFFRVFLFEDFPPSDRRPNNVYQDEVARSSIYLGIFGNEYGCEDDNGLSPTEKEFNVATQHKKCRLVLIKGRDDKSRNPKMGDLIQRAGNELVRKRFEDTDELLRLVYGSLIQYLQDRGFVAARDFDSTPCENATLDDISTSNVRRFVEMARDERKYTLPVATPPKRVLEHLNLLAGNVPTRGAILLFCDQPERFIRSAEVTCLHFHGSKVAKPIPSHQVYRGTAFDVVDKTVDFVLGSLTRRVEPGTKSISSTVTYEIPYDAIREAVVNAIAHRNYASKAAVQVMVFTDRVEVWNPGGLPEDLTVDQLRKPHHSVPRNRLLCEPLFLAHYIERAGTGTLDMIRLCNESGLPEPEFHHEGEHFVVVLWRHWLTDEMMTRLGLNERQKEGLAACRSSGRVTNSTYQAATGATRPTAKRDLEELVNLSILVPAGSGRGAHYLLAPKRLKNGSNGSPEGRSGNGS